MPKIQYKEINFRSKSLDLIRLVNEVIGEYKAQGYELTLRQTYYQLVARGYIPNNERSYKNIGSLINDGRLAGLIDWCAIIDRTRNLRRNSHWEKPSDVIYSAKYFYLLDKWKDQPNYVEVWVEKDALVDVVGQACEPLDVLTFRSSHAVATLPSLKCGRQHNGSSGRVTEISGLSYIWEIMTRPV